VPLLKDIPLFGSLFGTSASTTNRTELVVLITPRVVRTTQDMREIGQELKDRMKTLYPPEASTVQQGIASEQGRQ
jgi:general secretion pathway protein D